MGACLSRVLNSFPLPPRALNLSYGAYLKPPNSRAQWHGLLSCARYEIVRGNGESWHFEMCLKCDMCVRKQQLHLIG